MNIFVLSKNPITAAQMQCDQHVVKMPLETAQMLCTAFPNGYAPYRHTHYKHPCNVWLRTSKENYMWLVRHGFALCDEYEYRYGKTHSSRKVIDWCLGHIDELKFPQNGQTPFPIAMDDQYKLDTPVASYRNFYIKSKSRFSKWQKKRKQPKWFMSFLGKKK